MFVISISTNNTKQWVVRVTRVTLKENENAWKVSVDDLKDYNLDLNNPSDVEETIDLSPHELIDSILKDEEKTTKLLRDVRDLIKKEIPK